MIFDVAIVGGGAAGFFAAIQVAQQKPNLSVVILERGKEVLTKVKVSGGGRCNVTHAEFVPNELVKAYPRGQRELKGPFHTFCSGDTVAFFEERGVPLKIEEDGRMFPETDSSQTIIDCFTSEVDKLGIKVNTNCSVKSILPPTEEIQTWQLETSQGELKAHKLLVATGSNPKIWKLLETLGHTIVPPVSSLFTFNIKDNRINDLMGVSSPAEVKLLHPNKLPIKLENGQKAKASGPLLITHWGMSGPAILKLSAWGARELFQLKYHFKIQVNWLPKYATEEIFTELLDVKNSEAKKTITNTRPFDLPKRLWFKIIEASGIQEQSNWADISKKQLQKLATQLTAAIFEVNGKSTFKEEFVTAGGVALKEINFKSYESKLFKNLFFAGEVLNIDAVTGGFNFQNAWTGAFIAAQAICENS
ncbi:BaiN/RdsA family NAD(P)/FAD-dependent oxidoreductase [Galbibacter mesophilus]|uniref:NAD(P)/FAD-dependent oxidoreductase n=1 Tax=Galbibacter mesophilus TaxID=379069 RepID=UPI00191DA09E|nr:NAD(P)/FAD-dependent oxidoreductase [Galbibacter mesophilus]MCM5661832.1 NAD(P)/FAD-dependent oxidoreductase [Galbibacter mesophilus]